MKPVYCTAADMADITWLRQTPARIFPDDAAVITALTEAPHPCVMFLTFTPERAPFLEALGAIAMPGSPPHYPIFLLGYTPTRPTIATYCAWMGNLGDYLLIGAPPDPLTLDRAQRLMAGTPIRDEVYYTQDDGQRSKAPYGWIKTHAQHFWGGA